MISFESEMIEKLILDGALEVSALDSETGRILYSFTEKLEHVDPELFKFVLDTFYAGAMSLWEKGFVEITLEDADPRVRLTGKGASIKNLDELTSLEFAILETLVDQLEKDQ